MKTSLLTIATGASLLLGGAPLLIAQAPPAPPPPSPSEQVQQALQDMQAGLTEGLEGANHVIHLAQAAVHRLSAGHDHEIPEPSEPPEPPEPPEADYWMQWIEPFTGSARPVGPLVVGSPGEDGGAIREDLNIMSRIFSKAIQQSVERDRSDVAMGIVLSSLPGGRRPESIYWQGHGAMFLLNVKFPLAPTAARNEEQIEKKPDSAWERTRRELYGPKEPGRMPGVLGFGQNKPVAYDGDKVETLKTALLDALKNAANIRGLRPNDEIVIAVTGTASGAASKAVTRVKVEGEGPRTRKEVRVESGVSQTTGEPRATTLVIRAGKADVDAWAEGKLSPTDFRKKVNITVE